MARKIQLSDRQEKDTSEYLLPKALIVRSDRSYLIIIVVDDDDDDALLFAEWAAGKTHFCPTSCRPSPGSLPPAPGGLTICSK